MRFPVSKRRRSPSIAVAIIATALFLGACSLDKIPGVYRLDIQQGNVITQAQLDQLELGMDRRKVRFILGTPLLTDTFNENRWDYLYSLQEGGGDRVQRHVSLFFENDRLVRMEGEIRDENTPTSVRSKTQTIVTVPAERREEGFLAALLPDFMKKKPGGRDAAAGENAASAATTATTTKTDSEPASGDQPAATLEAQDIAYLEKLFEGYGKLDYGASGDSEPQPVASRESASP